MPSVCNDLPKIRTGKIMRRLRRIIAENLPIGTSDTLVNPEVIEQIAQDHIR